MVVAQGMLGYGITSVFGAIPAEIFQGRHYGSVFGTLMLAGHRRRCRGAVRDRRAARRHRQLPGGFRHRGFGVSLLSALAIWLAAPRQVRVVAGRAAGAG